MYLARAILSTRLTNFDGFPILEQRASFPFDRRGFRCATRPGFACRSFGVENRLVRNQKKIDLDALTAKRFSSVARLLHDSFNVCRDRVLEEADRARALRGVLLDWLNAAGAGWAGARHTDAATLARLAELGYADQLDGEPDSDAPPADCACEWCGRFR